MKRKMKIRKGDTVQVLTGRRDDKGRQGEVIKVIPKSNRIVVQGINMSKKHQRQQQAQGANSGSGIIEFEAQFDLSNVMLVCPKCKKPVRVGFQRDEEKSHRVCKSCDEIVD